MKRLGGPFAFKCFDDFDLIRLDTFYSIDSIYDINIGSTMIFSKSDKSNVCTRFILDNFVNRISSFRLDQGQL